MRGALPFAYDARRPAVDPAIAGAAFFDAVHTAACSVTDPSATQRTVANAHRAAIRAGCQAVRAYRARNEVIASFGATIEESLGQEDTALRTLRSLIKMRDAVRDLPPRPRGRTVGR